MIAMAVKQTAGRDTLGTFAPEFARLNDDILFGEAWRRESLLSLRVRSLVTVVSLMAQGLVDSSFRYHLETARKNGITRTEIADPHPCRFLCRLAQGLGCFPHVPGDLEGRCSRR